MRKEVTVGCALAVLSCSPSAPDPRSLLLEARTVLYTAPDSGRRMGRGQETAMWLARAGAYDDALTTAHMSPATTQYQYEYLLEIQARRGDLVGADSMVQHLIPSDHAAGVHLKLAIDAANRGDTAGAFRIARRLDRRGAESVRLETAHLMMRSGALADAESTVARAARAGVYVEEMRAELANAYYVQDDEARGDRLARLVHPSEAWDLGLDKILSVARHNWPAAIALIRKRSPIMQAQDYADIASDMFRRKDTAKALEAFDSAAAAALRLTDDIARLQILAGIAREQFADSLPAKAAALMPIPDFARPHTGDPYFACSAVEAFESAHRLDDVMEVNRREHCDRTDGAAAQFAAGDIDGAIRTLDRGDAGRYAVLVAQWTATAAVMKGIPTALHIFAILDAKRPSYDDEVAYAAAGIVRVMARTDPAGALAWARARRTPIQKAASLTALAQVIIIHQDSVAGRPFRQTP